MCKDVRRFPATNMDSLADEVKDRADHKNLEHFHEFLRDYIDISINNIYPANDFTYCKLRSVIQNKDIASVQGDKDFSLV